MSPDFDKEPWTGRIEYVGGWMLVWAIHINHGMVRYGPDGGPFYAFTEKGAVRKMNRELRRARARTAKRVGYRAPQGRVVRGGVFFDAVDQIEAVEDEFPLDESEPEDEAPTGPAYPKTRSLVARMGIDPAYVSPDGLDTTGYNEFTYGPDGNRLRNEDGTTFKTTRRAWPSLADGIRVVDQFIKEGGTR